MTHVPYKGKRRRLNDVVAGHVLADVRPIRSPSLQLVREGKLRALGVTTAKRVPIAPDMPPLAEAGLPGFDASGWHMFVGAGGNAAADRAAAATPRSTPSSRSPT